MKLDPRLLSVSIEMDGRVNTYSGLHMSVTIDKYANVLQNEATIRIINLSRQNRNFLITQTSPFILTAQRKRVIISAGRKSYGLSKVFEGDIVSCSPSQPPDIELTIKAKTCAFTQSDLIAASYEQPVPASQIAADVAQNMGLNLTYEADDKNVSGYNFSGSKSEQVKSLQDIGFVDVFVDDDKLVVKNKSEGVGERTVIVNKNSGMIGIPELNENGVKIKYLFDPAVTLGGTLSASSALNPAVNGDYIIYKLSYDLSNHNESFYNSAECRRADIWRNLTI